MPFLKLLIVSKFKLLEYGKFKVKIQNSLSKFHNFSFQSSKFIFFYFSPLSFNHSQFNFPLIVRLLVPLNYSKWCRFGLNLIFNIFLFFYLKKTQKLEGEEGQIEGPKEDVAASNSYHTEHASFYTINQNKRTNIDWSN